MQNSFQQASIAKLLEEGQIKEVSLKQTSELFETVYMPSRNLTIRTRVEYKTDIHQLIEFLEQCGLYRPAQVGLTHLQAFLADLDRRELAGSTRRRKMASIRAFFNFLRISGHVANDPAQQLIPPERGYKEPRFLTTQEYQALLRACSHHPRDAAIVELILQTGIRLSEAAHLTLHDVELPKRINRDPANSGSIFIQGKGRKSRTLPLNYKACRALKTWLSARPDIDDVALFVTKFKEPMGPRAIQRVVKKYMGEAGIRKASVHTLRHSFATHHVAQGTGLRTVQEALGHADLKTTSIYVSTAKEAMRRDLQNHAL